jgi:hypothetical protein
MSKQTAVEWLFNKMITEKHTISEWNIICKEAKEIEKEQIMEAFDECGNWQDKYSDSEHYYNETYKKDK